MERQFSDEQARDFITGYLAAEGEGFALATLRFLETVDGIRETCGGCTIHDGQDCVPPVHYVDEFIVVSKRQDTRRYSTLAMGWSEGGDNCINAFGDYNKVKHLSEAE